MSKDLTEHEACAAQIKAVRSRLGLSQKAFAERLETTQSNVAKWESGAYRPAPEQFMALARLSEGQVESVAFMQRAGVSNAWFEGRVPKGHMPTVLAEDAVRQAEQRRVAELMASGVIADLSGQLRYVPLLKDSAAAGTPRAVDEEEIEKVIPIPTDWLPRGGSLYAVTVVGDSMDPILLNGHIVIIDVESRNPKKLVNHMVAARGDGLTIKWLREDDGDLQLVPNRVSVRHPVMRLKKGRDLAIVGEVVKWIGEPPPVRK